jgi:FKBP-type peptidyl-prolyl cis-trans isomerase 2
MRTVQPGDRVQVHYVKRFQDGSTASSRQPVELIVGTDHPCLPGLGTTLVGLAMGEAATVTVPPERAYGMPDAARIRRWPRQRFPKEATLRAGAWVRLTTATGRGRFVRILEVQSKRVVVDTNHRGVGQSLELEVKLLAFLGPDPCSIVPATPQAESVPSSHPKVPADKGTV